MDPAAPIPFDSGVRANGFIRHQPGDSPQDAADGKALTRALLWSVQNQGMATYVAAFLAAYRETSPPSELKLGR